MDTRKDEVEKRFQFSETESVRAISYAQSGVVGVGLFCTRGVIFYEYVQEYVPGIMYAYCRNLASSVLYLIPGTWYKIFTIIEPRTSININSTDQTAW